ncbi:MAG TPA: hypothetical protein VF173_35280 [Thermoanaerobaculia bacterium]|nr:hypothetical protein [Thermoanaerobaculia bacterium]
MRFRSYILAAAAPFCLAGLPAAAWTPATQVTIAREAAHLSPPDLYRQIDKHHRAYEEGINAPFADADPSRHTKNLDGSGRLDRATYDAVDAAILAIRGHQPFDEIVRRLGVVSHFVADANNPLAASADDAEEGRYFADFLRYVETAEPRFPLVFYGLQVNGDGGRGVAAIVEGALRRGRQLYPLIGREYRRIGFGSGVGVFDDRSTAFGVGSVAFSHAVTDVSLVLRYIWLAAGGIDDRAHLPAVGTRLTVLPRTAR